MSASLSSSTPPLETIAIIGLGYIGLPTAAALAAKGVSVIGIDTNATTVATINRGEIHVVEPDLADVVETAVANGHLRAVTAPEPADAFVIAVPTPFIGESHQPDLSFIEAASRSIAPALRPGNLVILESTSPVGATEQMAQWLAEERPDLRFPHQAGEGSDIRISYCPERVLPGNILRELTRNDRIIGGMTERCANRARDFYRLFVEGECLLTDVRSAEMCKLAENAFRDINIAYANELSMVCDQLGVDVWEVIRFANHHPRVNILRPGTGVGGHCIAVDPWFIVAGAPEQARLIRTAREVNDSKPDWVLGKVREAVAEFEMRMGRAPMIAALGLAFKPDIDDLRESPAVQVAQALYAEYGTQMLAVEPHITSMPPAFGDCPLVSLQDARDQADILVLLVAHKAFADIERGGLQSYQLIIDAAGMLSAKGRAASS